MAWRKDVFGDGLLARLLVPDDTSSLALRATLVLFVIVMVSKEIAAAL